MIFVSGNQDEIQRDYDDAIFGNMETHNAIVHTTADKRKLLIIHGDQFDSVVKISPMLAKIGSRLYELLLRTNRWVNYLRRKIGLSYWSLAAFLKHKTKNAVQYISHLEEAVAHEVSKQGVNGVICGHIHRAEITRIHDIYYYNRSDWAEAI